MEIKIEKELFQWEKNRAVIIEGQDAPLISCVQFFNKKSPLAIEVEVLNNQALIPNILLKDPLPIIALACKGRYDDTQVLTRKEFKVLSRKKPEHYIDDPDDTGKEVIYDGGVEI